MAESKLDVYEDSAMNCPVCLEVMDSNIFLCEFGHSICEDCKVNKLENCPQCRIDLTGNRNYQLEQLIAEMKGLHKIFEEMGLVECSFSEAGCGKKLPAQTIQKHEKGCKHRTISCFFTNKGCTASSTVKEIKNHEENCNFRTVPCIHGCGTKLKSHEVEDHDIVCENTGFICRFYEYGCKEVLKMSQMREHEAECTFRFVCCIFRKDGCKEEFRLNKIKDHEAECDYRVTTCSFAENGCEETLFLAKRGEHETKCKFKLLSCVFSDEGCSETLNLEVIENHEAQCTFRVLPCSFRENGCNVTLKLLQMREHEKNCEFRTVSCVFQTNGCFEKLKLTDVAAHEIKCKHRSNRIALPKFKDMPLRCHICSVILCDDAYLVYYHNYSVCESCRSRFSYSYRNTNLELLIAELQKMVLIPCSFVRNGCEKFLQIDEKHNHEKECPFRDIPCKFEGCDWSGKIKLMPLHTILDHNLCLMKSSDDGHYSKNMIEDIDSNDIHFLVLKGDKQLFYCSIKKVDRDICWAIQLVGQVTTAKQYTYQIKICRNNQEISGMDECESDTISFESLLKQKKCVSFSYSTVEKFLDDKKLKFIVIIRNDLQ